MEETQIKDFLEIGQGNELALQDIGLPGQNFENESLRSALKKSYEDITNLFKLCSELQNKLVQNDDVLQQSYLLREQEKTISFRLKEECIKMMEVENQSRQFLQQLFIDKVKLQSVLEQGTAILLNKEAIINELLQQKDKTNNELDEARVRIQNLESRELQLQQLLDNLNSSFKEIQSSINNGKGLEMNGITQSILQNIKKSGEYEAELYNKQKRIEELEQQNQKYKIELRQKSLGDKKQEHALDVTSFGENSRQYQEQAGVQQSICNQYSSSYTQFKCNQLNIKGPLPISKSQGFRNIEEFYQDEQKEGRYAVRAPMVMERNPNQNLNKKVLESFNLNDPQDNTNANSQGANKINHGSAEESNSLVQPNQIQDQNSQVIPDSENKTQQDQTQKQNIQIKEPQDGVQDIENGNNTQNILSSVSQNDENFQNSKNQNSDLLISQNDMEKQVQKEFNLRKRRNQENQEQQDLDQRQNSQSKPLKESNKSNQVGQFKKQRVYPQNHIGSPCTHISRDSQVEEIVDIHVSQKHEPRGGSQRGAGESRGREQGENNRQIHTRAHSRNSSKLQEQSKNRNPQMMEVDNSLGRSRRTSELRQVVLQQKDLGQNGIPQQSGGKSQQRRPVMQQSINQSDLVSNNFSEFKGDDLTNYAQSEGQKYNKFVGNGRQIQKKNQMLIFNRSKTDSSLGIEEDYVKLFEDFMQVYKQTYQAEMALCQGRPQLVEENIIFNDAQINEILANSQTIESNIYIQFHEFTNQFFMYSKSSVIGTKQTHMPTLWSMAINQYQKGNQETDLDKDFDVRQDLCSLLGGCPPYKLFVGQYGIDSRKEWGVIALEDIKKGSVISSYNGEYMPLQEQTRRELEYRNFGIDRHYMYQLRYTYVPTYVGKHYEDQGLQLVSLSKHMQKQWGENRWRFMWAKGGSNVVIDATYVGNYSRWINHSCNPNLRAAEIDVPHGPTMILLYASRDIRRGEELGIDYYPTRKDHLRLKNYENSKQCLCKSKKCRNLIF